MSVDIKILKKVLKRLVDVLSEEAERNPAFATAISEAISPLASINADDKEKHKRPKGHKQDVILPLIDPFDLFREQGLDGLRSWLQSLSIPQLRSIIRQHRFDPSRLSDRWKTGERFIELICERVEGRSKHGDVFRNYSERPKDEV